MKYAFKNAQVYTDGHFAKADILVCGDTVCKIAPLVETDTDTVCYDLDKCFIFPGFKDVHVHLREPGFSYKETIETGTKAALCGGYTDVCAMPNLNPVPDSAENLKIQTDLIKEHALINVVPYGAITVGEKGEELADLSGMADNVIAFSDDGRGVQNEDMMKEAMEKAKNLNKIIAAHCEDNSLLNGGYIHKGEYAEKHGHRGICSESEWGPIKRDLELSKEVGNKYHVCHISCKESVELIREAKKNGVNVTCETGPHYLVFNDMDLKEEGRFKMNPPIRSESDRLALIEGLVDGTIDMIATDHAPHSAEEKSKGLEKSAMGVVGLETAFAVMYTHLVKKGIITLEKLTELMSINPHKRFGLGEILKEGSKADFCVFDLEKEYTVDPENFASMGKATPFGGMTLYGECVMTVKDGKIFKREEIIK